MKLTTHLYPVQRSKIGEPYLHSRILLHGRGRILPYLTKKEYRREEVKRYVF
jgi:hypothetical protein